MPLVHTRRFGPLEYRESSVLTFPAGLPGFDGQPLFTLVEPAELAPLVFLQSLNSPSLCFLAAPVTSIDPNYAPALTPEDLDRLGWPRSTGPELLCLALLCAPENGVLTANLLAPVVINPETRIAVQAVRADSKYSHQHPISGDAAC